MSGFYLILHEKYNPLIILFKEHYHQDMDLDNTWFDSDTESVEIEDFLTKYSIPFTIEEDPNDNDDHSDGAYITRFYEEGHANNATFSYAEAHYDLKRTLDAPYDTKLLSNLQKKYNPPELPQDISPTNKQIAVITYFVLTELPKDIF